MLPPFGKNARSCYVYQHDGAILSTKVKAITLNACLVWKIMTCSCLCSVNVPKICMHNMLMHAKLLRNNLTAGRSRKKIIKPEMNLKEPKLMDKLNECLCILNTMDIHDLNGRFIKFNV